MKRLTLVRHGHAKFKGAELKDFERPLSRRGKAEAKETAVALYAQGLIPELVLASPAARTLQTAEIFVRELHLAERQLRPQESLYLASADQLLQAVQGVGSRIGHLMIIGHNPGVSELANYLAPQAQLGELATSAACTMDFEVLEWPLIVAGSAANVQQEGPAPRFFGLSK